MTDALLLFCATLGATLGAWLLTGAVRRYANIHLLDQPNARSSHATPVPRGGGLAIALTFLAGLAAASAVGWVPRGPAAALGLAGLAVAALGFADDRWQVRARNRFLVHLVAGAWVLWCLRGIPEVPILGRSVDLGWFGIALAVVYLVWMTNLFNFMDGIDGIAAIEAITVTLGGALAWWIAAREPLAWIPVFFAACVAGFLIWNFPPAKIFMGDTGSGFIGMTIGIFSLWVGQAAPHVFWSWFILIGCFMVDATTTLVRRVRRGERAAEAHRSHAYQYASRVHRSHRRVSLSVAAINIFWLLPIALLVASRRIDGVAATLIAYIPLVWLAFRYKAGVRSEQMS